MISVIIPVLNESQTIAPLVAFARRAPEVGEVIVVDDGSIDGTPDLAREAGAKVVTSTLLGKGASMADGMWAATNETLVYLDGDLRGLREDLISAMAAPILEDRADFVKSRFSRSAGRVTTLTAKPLLRMFFPELGHLVQPLGGIVASRRSILRPLRFENDYGVDVGILLDVASFGARIAEVDIGHIEHDSQSLETLGDMAGQVVRVIVERAARYGRLRRSHICEVSEVERQMQAEMAISLQRVGTAERLALFDMDGTLLQGRYVVNLARRLNRGEELAKYLDNESLGAEERTHKIAAIFRGVPKETFEEVARNTPLQPGAAETVVNLRKAGYRVGIVTDSFRVAAEIVRRRVFADFSVSHIMKFAKEKATGDVTLCPAMRHPEGCKEHALCKVNVMQHLIDKMGVARANVIAVGDGENDVCMLRGAGTSFAYQPKSERVRAAAKFVLSGPLVELIPLIEPAVAPAASA